MQLRGAETVFDLDEDKKIILNNDVLYKILLQEEIRDKHVCVIAIAGAFRQGKSFILNFFLRYLHMKYKDEKKIKKWLEGSNESVSGFSWQPGSRRHTVGILMWPEIFLTELPSGEEVAIILLDTQGSFDVVTTMTECATIFALSTLISSVQIYNLKENIKQCDLGHLEYFVNYGQMVLKNSECDGPPFQNLLFLIRDWAWVHEHEFGFKGGKELLQETLNPECEKVSDEILQQRKNIQAMFKNISCFLMPHPGETVATDPDFKGELEKIAPKFKMHMEKFVPHILDSDNLIPKTVNGKQITAAELVDLIEIYWKCFESGKMPQLTTLLSASSKLQHIISVNEAESKYDESMNVRFGNKEEVLNDEDLKNLHEDSKNLAMNHYLEIKKMGDEATTERYKKILDEKLETKFVTYTEMNELRRQNHSGFIGWLKYIWSTKSIIGSVLSIVTPVSTVTGGYVGFTNSVAVAGVAAAEAITATVVCGSIGFAIGAVFVAPLIIISMAGGGWMLWSKRSSKKSTGQTINDGEEMVPLNERSKLKLQ